MQGKGKAVMGVGLLIVGTVVAGSLVVGRSSQERTPDPRATADRMRVQAALDRRAAAVLARDLPGWAGSLSPAVPGFRAAQLAVFDRLSALPLTLWRYEIIQLRSAAGMVVVQVQLHYRLAQDSRDVVRDQYLTMVPGSDGWALRGDGDGPTQRVDLWDRGSITVVRGSRSVVVGSGAGSTVRARLTLVAAQADQAARRIDQVWGTAWPRRVVVLVPDTLVAMAALLGRSTSNAAGQAGLDRLAAATTGILGPGGLGDRVVLNPATFPSLLETGRRVVLAHELTHLATRATGALPPLWVQEGFADYVGYLGSGLPATAVAADLLAPVRADGPPAHLPGAGAFDPARGEVTAAYAGAWLACRLIARDGGTARLVAFYRAAGSGGLEGAFTRVLGESSQRFEERWRAYLRTLAAQPPTT